MGPIFVIKHNDVSDDDDDDDGFESQQHDEERTSSRPASALPIRGRRHWSECTVLRRR